uniref:Uncharacterized protein n=1 Tax=Oryza brachyantha TaxID=4533 RepID=J3M5A8_ORYBR
MVYRSGQPGRTNVLPCACKPGLDPKSTADLFSSAAWVCERCIDGDDCFVLRVDASHAALRARSSGGVEDSHLLRVRLHGAAAGESAYWETTMESSVGDYRAVDGINIAHAGRTVVSLSRFDSAGDADADAAARGKRSCTTMEETWSIEEVDFNVVGLSMDCFLPPRDLVLNECKKQQHHHQKVEDAAGDKDIAGAAAAAKGGSDEGKANGGDTGRGTVARKALVPAVTGLGWFGPAKVVAVDDTVDDAAPAATDDDKLDHVICSRSRATGGDTGRGTVARKALVPAVTGLGWFGPAKVVAVDDTVDDAAPAATDDDK